MSITRENKAQLSLEEAQRRYALISDLAYDLKISLLPEEKRYEGQVALNFSLKDPNDLTIDFTDGKVQAVEVNGEAQNVIYNGFFLEIDGACLKAGANVVSVRYEHAFSENGSGFYLFKDPEDGKSYTYTDFEPYDANRLFPCFDQPDLKARYTLTATAPKDWLVVSAQRESRVTDSDQHRIWHFPETKAFSTYIFSLHAGPYQVFEDAESFRIPLRLMCRPSMAKYIDTALWFKLTRQGFDFFESYFDYPYPFEKYDQLVVPDFNAGAMENVGAVTFSERYIPKGFYTRLQKLSLAEVILHEMAHMWFGNLVTMKWWNDLWLNESFATYISYVAMDKGTEFSECWVNFFDDIKAWAYREDSYVTTHAIETDVSDTAQAFTNFDGISYGKGASALKQLVYALGEDAFQRGIQIYFKAFAFQNTQRIDFIGSLEQASGRALSQWTEQWLQTTGTDAVTFSWTENTSELFLEAPNTQSNAHKAREHHFAIGHFSRENGELVKRETIRVNHTGSSQTIALGQPIDPDDFIYVNYGDHDFININLDRRSQMQAIAYLPLFADVLDRNMLLKMLWDSCYDGEMPAAEFVDRLIPILKDEANLDVQRKVFDMLRGSAASPYRSIRALLTTKVEREDLDKRLHEVYYTKYAASEQGSDERKVYFSLLLSTHGPHANQPDLVENLASKEFDQDQRWRIIQKLGSLGYDGINQLIATELEMDGSSGGQESALMARVMAPNLSVKKDYLNQIWSDATEISKLSQKRAIMAALLPLNQEPFRMDLEDALYQLLDYARENKELEFIEAVGRYVYPCRPEEKSVARLAGYIETHTHMAPNLRKHLRIKHQLALHCLKKLQR